MIQPFRRFSPLEGIEKAAQLHPEIVLLDIGMPNLNRIETAQKLRRASPLSKIVFITQENDHDLRCTALAAGAEGYVLKSRVVSELIPTTDALGMASGAQIAFRVSAIFTMPLHSLAIEQEQHRF